MCDKPDVFKNAIMLVLRMTQVQILTRAIDWLEKLIAFDTRNGPGSELPCAQFLRDALAAHNPESLILETVSRTRDRPEGAYVLAIWGTPEILLNVHLDTVPSGQGWDADPHVLRRDGDKLIGLGASDIKGAMACILAAMETGKPENVAVLFSGDEEAGSEVMEAIIARGHMSAAPRAIICEPTGCRVGQRHRGFMAYMAQFSGPGGHSSLSDSVAAPVLFAARLGAALGDYGAANIDAGSGSYNGLCVNVGMIDSDGAHNVIPTRAELRVSLRPPPGDDVAGRETDLAAIFEAAPVTELSSMAVQPPLQTRDLSGFAPYFAGEETRPIDLPYWTEAAMLSAAGTDCVVYGPGDVEQAHRPNEFVTRQQLETAMQVYARALFHG